MKNKTVLTLTATAVALFLAGCNDQKEETVAVSEDSAAQLETSGLEGSQDLQTIETAQPTTDNATLAQENTWQGVYHGILPCADCEGQETQLMLNGDESFEMTVTYLGKNEEPSTTTGKLQWNEQNTKVMLMDSQGQQVGHYAVSQGTLTQLDNNGEPIKGDLAAQYTLKKEPMGMEE